MDTELGDQEEPAGLDSVPCVEDPAFSAFLASLTARLSFAVACGACFSSSATVP